MDPNTPALQIRPKDRQANTAALRDCLSRIPRDTVKRIADIRYGLGGWAIACRSHFPEATIIGYEQDPETAERAWRDERVTLYAKPYENQPMPSIDLLMVDNNVLTGHKRNSLDNALAALLPAYLIFTDVACSKLHINYKSYGLTENNLEAYWQRFLISGYDFILYFRHHFHASTALYKKR